MRLAITYDISSDKIRNKVFEILESYGAWKQLSVFEVEVTDTQRLELEDRIQNKIEDEDHVRIYSLCDHCEDKVKNFGESNTEESSPVV